MTPPASHHPFLRSIIARPGDDAPRLIYADFLTEQGEGALADYIRVMCQPGRKPVTWRVTVEPDRWDGADVVMEPRWGAVTRRPPLSMFDYDQTVAMLPSPRLFDVPITRIVAHRGFVSRFLGRVPDWAASGPLFAWHPLRAVRLFRPIPVRDRWGFPSPLVTGIAGQHIPTDLFGRLTGGFDDNYWRLYPSPDAAWDAMTRAAIHFARAGLGFHPAPPGGHAVAHARNTTAEGRDAESVPSTTPVPT